MQEFILCKISYYAKFQFMYDFIICKFSYYARFHTGIMQEFILCKWFSYYASFHITSMQHFILCHISNFYTKYARFWLCKVFFQPFLSKCFLLCILSSTVEGRTICFPLLYNFVLLKAYSH